VDSSRKIWWVWGKKKGFNLDKQPDSQVLVRGFAPVKMVNRSGC
jgi:hypothetical protein